MYLKNSCRFNHEEWKLPLQVSTFIYLFIYQFVGRDGSVGIATRYWLDIPKIESRWRDICRTRPDRPWDPGVKRSERGVNHPSPSSTVVKEIVELYVYSPLCVDGTLYGEIYFLAYYLYSARWNLTGISIQSSEEAVYVQLQVSCLWTVPLHEIKGYNNGGIAPLILNIGTRWRWVVSFTPRPLYRKVKAIVSQ